MRTWARHSGCDPAVIPVILVVLATCLSTGSAGALASDWAELPLARDARLVHVAPEGNPRTANGTALRPYRSIERAKRQVRHRSADRLLIRAGSVWHTSLGRWLKSGRSATEPMVIGVYGEGPRPVFNTGDVAGILNVSPRTTVSHLVIRGIELRSGPHPNQAAYGMLWRTRLDDVLFEDVLIAGYRVNVNIETASKRESTGVRFNRCIVLDSYSTSSHSQGMFLKGVRGMVIDECVLDHNGWRDQPADARPTKFCHNIYGTRSNPQLTIRGSLLSRASSHAFTCRDGVIVGNLLIGNSIASSAQGRTRLEDNVVLAASRKLVFGDRHNPETGGERGWGFQMNESTRATGNIVAFTPGGRFPLKGIARQWRPENIVHEWGEMTDPGERPGAAQVGAFDWSGIVEAHRRRPRGQWPEGIAPARLVAWVQESFSSGTPPLPAPDNDPVELQR